MNAVLESSEVATEAEQVCYQAYQVVGSLLSDLGIFDAPESQKILDNLSQARLVHDDVLPWPSYAPDDARAVLEQALEALELHGKQYPHMAKGYCLDAITAIRAHLSKTAKEDDDA